MTARKQLATQMRQQAQMLNKQIAQAVRIADWVESVGGLEHVKKAVKLERMTGRFYRNKGKCFVKKKSRKASLKKQASTSK